MHCNKHTVIKAQQNLLALIYPGDRKNLFKGCFGFIFNIIVNIKGFCLKKTSGIFIMK